MIEGRGYLIHAAPDGPWAGWLGIRALDAKLSLRTAPWRALGALAEACDAFPAGLSLVWDGPTTWLLEQPAEHRGAFLGLLVRLPGLSLHLSDPGLLQELDGPVRAWLHAPEPPTGGAGLAWRQGWIGWMPDQPGFWRLPGLGRAPMEDDQLESGALWGELVLPIGALAHLELEPLLRDLSDAQARAERALSHRLSMGAWPTLVPFQRRRTGWRVALLGGREYAQSGGSWETAAVQIAALVEQLRDTLRCPVSVGTAHGVGDAALLGHQAMREGLPWRYSLPMPPAMPVFATGLAADPRDAVPLDMRAHIPEPLEGLLTHPPVAWLRIPSVPNEAAVLAFIRGLSHQPAVHWLPPGVPPPGPHRGERPWTAASAYPPVADVTSALQPALFGEDAWD